MGNAAQPIIPPDLREKPRRPVNSNVRSSMINIKDAEEFKQLLKALSDDVVDAHIHFQMYEELIEAIDKHPLVVHQSNTFWTFTLQAHLNSCVYALFRAYDQDTRALHLRSWLTTIQENLYLFDEESFPND